MWHKIWKCNIKFSADLLHLDLPEDAPEPRWSGQLGQRQRGLLHQETHLQVLLQVNIIKKNIWCNKKYLKIKKYILGHKRRETWKWEQQRQENEIVETC